MTGEQRELIARFMLSLPQLEAPYKLDTNPGITRLAAFAFVGSQRDQVIRLVIGIGYSKTWSALTNLRMRSELHCFCCTVTKAIFETLPIQKMDWSQRTFLNMEPSEYVRHTCMVAPVLMWYPMQILCCNAALNIGLQKHYCDSLPIWRIQPSQPTWYGALNATKAGLAAVSEIARAPTLFKEFTTADSASKQFRDPLCLILASTVRAMGSIYSCNRPEF